MNLFGILDVFADLINLATPIVVALALLYFFWGLATFVLSAGEDDGKKKGKSIMIYGILALFIMVSVWGIINVVRDTFNIQDNVINVPRVNVDNLGGQTQ